MGTLSAGLRHLAQRKTRELWKGLAVLRSLRGGSRVVAFVLVAVFFSAVGLTSLYQTRQLKSDRLKDQQQNQQQIREQNRLAQQR